MSIPGLDSKPDQDKEVDIESQLSPTGSRNTTFNVTDYYQHRGSLAGPSHLSETRRVSSPTTKDESSEKESTNTGTGDKNQGLVQTEETGTSSVPLPLWWQRRTILKRPTRWKFTWSSLHYALTSGIFIAFVVLLVLYLINQNAHTSPLMSNNGTLISNITQLSNPNNQTTISSIILQPHDVPPLLDTALGAANIYFGKLLSNTTSEDQTILVYSGPKGRLCILWKTGGSFRNNVQCELPLSLSYPEHQPHNYSRYLFLMISCDAIWHQMFCFLKREMV